MSIRQAILNAADQVEREVTRYSFDACSVPGPCGSPGCMIGWIGHFAGLPAGVSITRVEDSLGIESSEFYARIRTVSKNNLCAWLAAEDVPKALRAYADKYHPAESLALIPASVRAIFEMTPAQIAREFERA